MTYQGPMGQNRSIAISSRQQWSIKGQTGEQAPGERATEVWWGGTQLAPHTLKTWIHIQVEAFHGRKNHYASCLTLMSFLRAALSAFHGDFFPGQGFLPCILTVQIKDDGNSKKTVKIVILCIKVKKCALVDGCKVFMDEKKCDQLS